MTKRTCLAGAAAVCGVVLLSAGLLAQDKPRELSPEEQAMMAAWTAYATPGPEHQQLANKVGDWTLQVKMWHGPGAEMEVSEATSKITSIMGGRYFLERVEGEYMNTPFEGRTLFGFDNLTKTYFAIWVDNFGTGPMYYKGAGDGKTIRYVVDMPDLTSSQYKKARAIEQSIDKDTYVHTMYETAPDGTEYKAMEITAVRRGDSSAPDTTKSRH